MGLQEYLRQILAARRVEPLADLQPLLTAVGSSNDVDSPAMKALQQLASGLQDVSSRFDTRRSRRLVFDSLNN